MDTCNIEEIDENQQIEERRKLLMAGKLKGGRGGKKTSTIKSAPTSASPQAKKRTKENRKWNNGGTSKDQASLGMVINVHVKFKIV